MPSLTLCCIAAYTPAPGWTIRHHLVEWFTEPDGGCCGHHLRTSYRHVASCILRESKQYGHFGALLLYVVLARWTSTVLAGERSNTKTAKSCLQARNLSTYSGCDSRVAAIARCCAVIARVASVCSVVHKRAFEHNVEVETGRRRQEPPRTAGDGRSFRGDDSAVAYN